MFSRLVLKLVQARHIGRVYEEIETRTENLEAAYVDKARALSDARRSLESLEARYEQLDEMVSEFDRFNRLVYMSPNTERLMGYPLALLQEQPFVGLPEDLVPRLSNFAARIQLEDLSGDFEIEIRLGRQRIVAVVAVSFEERFYRFRCRDILGFRLFG